ncbi:hypothetical protein [Pyxidicoccus sp. MSG2]|jgi:hypothetical protein|uniref:hypothetical protein n=1 Tax=Pyxidicoccus sp. MSG2 TaxID=2996790 RepID=UPI00226DFC7B|nr:hypothetical protein [Pyxidicoccus sp. MSG2]MCY1016953.1 hypothetical protein [Pyxidicoccus sp. MSG2]
MKRTLSLVAGLGLSLASLGAFAAPPKAATTDGQKPAAAAPAKPATKGKKAKAHAAAPAKPAPAPAEGSSGN